MKAKILKDILYKAIPDSESWSKGEPYGAYNVPDDLEVNRVLYCVTPTDEVVSYFREHGFDLLISHHPYHVVDDIPHLIFHTALDCCEGGLNDMWRDALGIKNAEHFDENLGWYGVIEPLPFTELVDKIKSFAGGVIGQVHSTKDIISSVCVCSGLGGMVVSQASKTGADCYIVGEMTSPAESSGFPAIIETGHTLSEWIGVRFFEKLLKPHGVSVEGAPQDIDYFGSEHFNNKYGSTKNKGEEHESFSDYTDDFWWDCGSDIDVSD